jgi:hypothetical protein
MSETELFTAGAAHEAFRKDVLALVDRHGGHLSAQEMLAVAAYLAGQLVAHQDQRSMTHAMAFEIVFANIVRGNSDAVSSLHAPRGTA